MAKKRRQVTARPLWPGGIRFSTGILLLVAATLPGCKEEVVPEPFAPSRAYDAYVFGLEQSGLADTALVRDWVQVGKQALSNPQSIELPFREAIYMDPTKPAAFGFQFGTTRGQVIKILVEDQANPGLRLYVDVFRGVETGPEPFRLIASADGRERHAQFEPRADNEYILRIQPELLRGGHFTLSVVTQPAFDFPVQGRSTSAILSTFGVPREAGRRTHHGVDIFAPRHTPVLAPTRAYVRRVGENDLGGNVVWLTDSERSLSLYFAHLQEAKVEQGVWVNAGDVIGSVGNSGNARTTSTHLHFGVYSRGQGPIDPYYYLHSISGDPAEISVDLASLGQWVRVRDEGTRLHQGPSRSEPTLRQLGLEIPLRVIGASAQYLKLRLPDGSVGYAAERLLAPASEPLEVLTLSQDSSLWDRAGPEAVQIGRVQAGTEVSILGEFDDAKLVANPSANAWIRGRAGRAAEEE